MLSTKNYDVFTMHASNREINILNIKKIKASLCARNMLHLRPIVVNKKMEIKDGQHRFLAAKELGLEIFYQIDDDGEDYDIVLLVADEFFEKEYSLLKDLQNLLSNSIPSSNKFFIGARFLRAFFLFSNKEGFNSDIFMKQVRKKLDLIHSCSTTLSYVNMLKTVYNHGNRDPIDW